MTTAALIISADENLLQKCVCRYPDKLSDPPSNHQNHPRSNTIRQVDNKANIRALWAQLFGSHLRALDTKLIDSLAIAFSFSLRR